jgi:hypothetical protein
VADVFGYHALQLGLPELDTLRTNRMPHKCLAQAIAAPPCTDGWLEVPRALVPRTLTPVAVS